eukprot:31351-Pelagococcus_subviridis.AAC.15
MIVVRARFIKRPSSNALSSPDSRAPLLPLSTPRDRRSRHLGRDHRRRRASRVGVLPRSGSHQTPPSPPRAASSVSAARPPAARRLHGREHVDQRRVQRPREHHQQQHDRQRREEDARPPRPSRVLRRNRAQIRAHLFGAALGLRGDVRLLRLPRFRLRYSAQLDVVLSASARIHAREDAACESFHAVTAEGRDV